MTELPVSPGGSTPAHATARRCSHASTSDGDGVTDGVAPVLGEGVGGAYAYDSSTELRGALRLGGGCTTK